MIQPAVWPNCSEGAICLSAIHTVKVNNPCGGKSTDWCDKHTLFSLTLWEAPSMLTIWLFQRFISYFHKKHTANLWQQCDLIQTDFIFFFRPIIMQEHYSLVSHTASATHWNRLFVVLWKWRGNTSQWHRGVWQQKWAANCFKCNCASPLMLAGLNCRKHSSRPLPNALAPVDAAPSWAVQRWFVCAGQAVPLSEIPGVPPSIRVIALAIAQETTPRVASVYL